MGVLEDARHLRFRMGEALLLARGPGLREGARLKSRPADFTANMRIQDVQEFVNQLACAEKAEARSGPEPAGWAEGAALR